MAFSVPRHDFYTPFHKHLSRPVASSQSPVKNPSLSQSPSPSHVPIKALHHLHTYHDFLHLLPFVDTHTSVRSRACSRDKNRSSIALQVQNLLASKPLQLTFQLCSERRRRPTMSASPVPPTTAQSQKRPLEEPSSDAGVEDQPEAKRPALGKEQVADKGKESAAGTTNGTSVKDEPDDDIVTKEEPSGNSTAPDSALTLLPQNEVLQTQPIQSTAAANGNTGSGSPYQAQHVDETNWLHVRAIISSAEAATVIGKGGENVTLIRRMSGAKCTVSDYSRGAVERILTVSGLPDAIAKVRRFPLAHSDTYTMLTLLTRPLD